MKSHRIALPVIVLCWAIVVSLAHISGAGQACAQDQAGGTRYTGHENHRITLDLATKLVRNYRATAASGTAFGEYFGQDAVKSLLAQAGNVGMRIYYGKNDAGQTVLVLVGVDNNGRDLTEGVILEIGSICPPICDSAGKLGQ
jgi:hypothetical protein